MNKLLLYALPLLFICLAALLLTGGGWLKKPLGHNDDLLLHIEHVETYIDALEWDKAKKAHRKAANAWDIISKRVQFSVERDDMQAIQETIAKIEGGIQEENPSQVYPELYYFYDLWADLG